MKKTIKKPIINWWAGCTKQNDVDNKQLLKAKLLIFWKFFSVTSL